MTLTKATPMSLMNVHEVQRRVSPKPVEWREIASQTWARSDGAVVKFVGPAVEGVENWTLVRGFVAFLPGTQQHVYLGFFRQCPRGGTSGKKIMRRFKTAEAAKRALNLAVPVSSALNNEHGSTDGLPLVWLSGVQNVPYIEA